MPWKLLNQKTRRRNFYRFRTETPSRSVQTRHRKLVLSFKCSADNPSPNGVSALQVPTRNRPESRMNMERSAKISVDAHTSCEKFANLARTGRIAREFRRPSWHADCSLPRKNFAQLGEKRGTYLENRHQPCALAAGRMPGLLGNSCRWPGVGHRLTLLPAARRRPTS